MVPRLSRTSTWVTSLTTTVVGLVTILRKESSKDCQLPLVSGCIRQRPGEGGSNRVEAHHRPGVENVVTNIAFRKRSKVFRSPVSSSSKCRLEQHVRRRECLQSIPGNRSDNRRAESSVRVRGVVVVEALAGEYRREFGGDPGRMPIQAIVFSAARR